MIPELRLEVPDTPDQIRRPVNLQPGRSNQNDRPRNLRLSLSRRTAQPIIDLSSPTPPNDDRRKRKSPSSVMSISESSSPESCCSKRGKNVAQEVEDESCRGPTVRDNKGKGKVDTRTYDGCFQDLSTDYGLNSSQGHVGQRLLVRSGVTAPSNTARRDVAINHVSTGGDLSKAGEADRRGPVVRDDKGKGKLNGSARNDEIQVISPSQSCPSVLPRPVRRRFLVRNGVIAPINIAERNAASNNGNARDDVSAAKRAELGADRKVTVSQSSGAMQRTSGGQGSRPAGSSSVEGAGDDAVLSEIVADDPCRDRVIRSRRSILYGYTSDRGQSTYFQLEYEDEIDARENNATGPSSTSTLRSTESDMPGWFNQPSSGRSRPNLAASTASVSAMARPISGASTSTSRTGGLGAHPQNRRIRTASSLYEVGSSSATRNLRTQATDLTAATRAARIRRFQGQGVVLQPVIDVDEIDSPDAAASVRGQQLAHDEMIARQLQEELYNEIPGDWNMDEMDARMAMSLQQEENAMRSSPIRRRASRVGRSAQFVAASSFARNNFRLQMLQDFDSDDYETLLALDENNHQHTGASTRQINTLPESVVMSSNLDETCAVCLETPSIGEKIRHLPCFHKFHKDCIDQWLQRKKECPICKCSIF